MSRITGMNNLVTPDNDDLLPIVDVSDTTQSAEGSTKNIKAEDLVNTFINQQDGWLPVDESWTYASATTVTVPSGATNRFQIGDKIRLVQGASTKYFYVIGATSTVLTLFAGTSFTLADSAITQIYLSRASAPFGFPSWFNFNSTSSGSGSMTVTQTGLGYARFAINNRVVNVLLNGTHTTGGTASDAIIMTLPTQQVAGAFNWAVGCRILDGSGVAGYARSGGSTTVNFYRYDGASYGLGPNRIVACSFAYEI